MVLAVTSHQKKMYRSLLMTEVLTSYFYSYCPCFLHVRYIYVHTLIKDKALPRY